MIVIFRHKYINQYSLWQLRKFLTMFIFRQKKPSSLMFVYFTKNNTGRPQRGSSSLPF